MKLDYRPLLKVQRDLYEIPRGFGRFRAYLAKMVGDTRDIELPLVAMNPMGKEHLPELLDRYLAAGADEGAAAAVREASPRVAHVPGEFRVTLVLADDLKGGWTDRHAAEWSHRFESRPMHRRGWLVGLLWSSEEPSARRARDEALAAVHRGAYVQEHGNAATLRQMLAQEGFVQAHVGAPEPALEDEELEFTRQVLAPYLDASDRPTVIAGLFGDEVARKLGYSPLGLGPRAGLALAHHQARTALPR